MSMWCNNVPQIWWYNRLIYLWWFVPYFFSTLLRLFKSTNPETCWFFVFHPFLLLVFHRRCCGSRRHCGQRREWKRPESRSSGSSMSGHRKWWKRGGSWKWRGWKTSGVMWGRDDFLFSSIMLNLNYIYIIYIRILLSNGELVADLILGSFHVAFWVVCP